jgi:hypothetical protein
MITGGFSSKRLARVRAVHIEATGNLAFGGARASTRLTAFRSITISDATDLRSWSARQSCRRITGRVGAAQATSTNPAAENIAAVPV